MKGRRNVGEHLAFQRTGAITILPDLPLQQLEARRLAVAIHQRFDVHRRAHLVPGPARTSVPGRGSSQRGGGRRQGGGAIAIDEPLRMQQPKRLPQPGGVRRILQELAEMARAKGKSTS